MDERIYNSTYATTLKMLLVLELQLLSLYSVKREYFLSLIKLRSLALISLYYKTIKLEH